MLKFKEQASTFSDTCPDGDDGLQWLALMQHHGAPTRLLDFTESVDVAAFFALAEAASGYAAIWAVDKARLHHQLCKQLTTLTEQPAGPYSIAYRPPVLDHLLKQGANLDGYAAGLARPVPRNGRSGYQKGLFVYSLNMRHTLEENIYGMFGLSAEAARALSGKGFYGSIDNPSTFARLQGSPIIKFLLPHSLRREALRSLRSRGIGYTELFNDLDGFARALGHDLYDLTVDPE